MNFSWYGEKCDDCGKNRHVVRCLSGVVNEGTEWADTVDWTECLGCFLKTKARVLVYRMKSKVKDIKLCLKYASSLKEAKEFYKILRSPKRKR